MENMISGNLSRASLSAVGQSDVKTSKANGGLAIVENGSLQQGPNQWVVSVRTATPFSISGSGSVSITVKSFCYQLARPCVAYLDNRFGLLYEPMHIGFNNLSKRFPSDLVVPSPRTGRSQDHHE